METQCSLDVGEFKFKCKCKVLDCAAVPFSCCPLHWRTNREKERFIALVRQTDRQTDRRRIAIVDRNRKEYKENEAAASNSGEQPAVAVCGAYCLV